MKCTNCNGRGYFPLTAWHIALMMDCSEAARRCPVCDGLGATVERLPYQGPDSPEYKERMKRDEETVEMFQQWRLNLTDEEKAQLGIRVTPAPYRKPIWFP